MGELKSVSGSRAEDLFIDIFTDTFGADKAGFLYSQYPFFDLKRLTDFRNARKWGISKQKRLKNGCFLIGEKVMPQSCPKAVSAENYYKFTL